MDTALWHPFADMAVVNGREFVLDRGEGVWLWDEAGNRYLDATASLWYANVGHGREEIVDAVAAQMRKLEAYSIFGDMANRPALDLARRLSELAPMPDARAFLVTGGGEAIETAMKLSRLYFAAKGEPERSHIVSRTYAYHGSHGFGTSAGGIDPNRGGFGPLVGSMSRVPWDSVDALEREIAAVGSDNVAAFVFEPVIGAGGVLAPPDGYVEGVTELCQSQGILVIADSTICGFGRLGSWFGVERWGIEPDMIIFAKGVTSGYLPLGGVMIHGRVAEPFWSEPGRMFRHGPTYAGHPAACVAGLVNIDIMEREGLVAKGAELEQDLLSALAPLAEHPLVGEVRAGTGMMAAVELAPEVLERNPRAPWELYLRAREAGVLLRPMVRSCAISPPLTITGEQILEIAAGVRAGLDAMS
jgi:adenosylmethionine-8-amino-7-oxononanoate aminotransferase